MQTKGSMGIGWEESLAQVSEMPISILSEFQRVMHFSDFNNQQCQTIIHAMVWCTQVSWRGVSAMGTWARKATGNATAWQTVEVGATLTTMPSASTPSQAVTHRTDGHVRLALVSIENQGCMQIKAWIRRTIFNIVSTNYELKWPQITRNNCYKIALHHYRWTGNL